MTKKFKQKRRRGETKSILDELVQRFTDGEKLSKEQIIEQYFEFNSKIQYLEAKNIVKGWLSNSIKRKLWHEHQKAFGCIDDNKKYGIPETVGEAVYRQNGYYSLVKGIITNAERFAKYSQSQNLLPNIKEEQLVISHVIKK